MAIDKPLNLLTQELGNSGTNDHATNELMLTVEQESLLLAQASLFLDQLKYSSQEKDNIMWIPNLNTNQMLAITALGLTTVLPAEAAVDKFAAGVCQTARQTLPAEISPISNAASYILYHQNHLMRGDENLFDGAKVRILMKRKHGVLELEDDQLAVESSWYRYNPKVGFEGTDRFVMQVEKSGIKVKIYYVIEVLGDEAAAGYCPKEFWKISSNLPTGTDDYTNWQNTATLSEMLANASQSLTSFSDLAGTAVGETKGEGSTAQITLDSTAAGHNWFIDTTPSNNEEFLPTSDPEVWIAKAGSDAAGKMDMLSVLLHEYGHALGIEHSSDSADYMAASLQPGERRLPSAEELGLMARLVAAIKSESNDQSDPSSPTTPDQPGLPLASIGLAALARLRRGDYGWTLSIDQSKLVQRVNVNALSQDVQQLLQKETAIHSTLQQDNSAWQTAGNVSTSNNDITLAEN